MRHAAAEDELTAFVLGAADRFAQGGKNVGLVVLAPCLVDGRIVSISQLREGLGAPSRKGDTS